MAFFGRKKELEQLKAMLDKRVASLVVIKGRRRIGKSRLVQEFSKNIRSFVFSGIPPTEKTTELDQLHEFGWQLGKAVGQLAFKDDNWNDAFLRLANYARNGRILIVFDEISWLGSKDPNFLGKLKNVWDLEFKQNPNLILVLCGSVSAWIDKNILSSTGFLGRISLNLEVEELPLCDCNQFWSQSGSSISAYEKCKILAVTGGVPKYLEEIQPSLFAEENIKNLCFNKAGLLFNEFDHIFSDIFSNRSEIYKRITQCISENACDCDSIYKNLNVAKSGTVIGYLDDLVKSGFIMRDYTWHLKTGKQSKLSRYRISDNYLRFYLKYILPNKDKIERNLYDRQALSNMPAWSSIMGLQFENLVLHNRDRLWKLLKLDPSEIVYDNPFFQNQTKGLKGCQIDYLIQTKFNTLYVCEIKFSKNFIGKDVIKEVQEKVKNISMPKRFSIRPVLVHINGVSAEVEESGYFSQIINFEEFLNE